MDFVWDADKASANREKHRLSFEAATLVFDDPMLTHEVDPHPDEDRWRVIGRVNQTTLFVVYTMVDDDATIRIISARRATASERKRYQSGYS